MLPVSLDCSFLIALSFSPSFIYLTRTRTNVNFERNLKSPSKHLSHYIYFVTLLPTFAENIICLVLAFSQSSGLLSIDRIPSSDTHCYQKYMFYLCIAHRFVKVNGKHVCTCSSHIHTQIDTLLCRFKLC